jgi:hypothetical protein
LHQAITKKGSPLAVHGSALQMYQGISKETVAGKEAVRKEEEGAIQGRKNLAGADPGVVPTLADMLTGPKESLTDWAARLAGGTPPGALGLGPGDFDPKTGTPTEEGWKKLEKAGGPAAKGLGPLRLPKEPKGWHTPLALPAEPAAGGAAAGGGGGGGGGAAGGGAVKISGIVEIKDGKLLFADTKLEPVGAGATPVV